MFEQAIYDYIKNNFTVSGFTLKFGFGDIGEDNQYPYIIQNSLDADGSRPDVCADNQFTKGGIASLQWTIYHKNISNAFYIKRQLDKFISAIKKLTFDGKDYIVYLTTHDNSTAGVWANGLNSEILSKTLTYEVQ
ncbi:MAG: hypothetical protein BV457_00210 [Thermoplasmata archaeon M9B1D]|nr:MAG: hypothetical protein BV457_00210 [Thermoplasmata archaeon M9B1D]PNX52212.1 MAG: hypothetical protein BV456_00085 [Thermoplasmata archaeon M8B2D]